MTIPRSESPLANLPLEERSTCPICQSPYSGSDRFFRSQLGLIDPYDIKYCGRCDVRWLSPRPTSAGYEVVYSRENYFSGDRAVEQYADLAALRRLYFRARIIRIEAILCRRPLSILDVGAATGDFVTEAIGRGHTAIGWELSEDARDMARHQHGIVLYDPRTAEIPDGSLDVVHLNHVLEHLPSPMESLCAYRRMLRSDGLLVIEVPQQIHNDLELLKRLLLRPRRGFNSYSLHHTTFFTPKSISISMRRAGFTVISLSTFNAARTPLKPFVPRSLFLRAYLYLADRIHRRGNIIEVYARPT